MRKLNFCEEKGQSLVSLLFFMIVAVTITSASAIILLTNSLAANTFQQGGITMATAESGVENAILRLLRDPSYSGETLVLENGTAQISVSGTNPKTIVSVGRVGSFQRQVQVNVVDNNGIITVVSWKEIF